MFLRPRKSDHFITPERVFDYAKKEWNLNLKKMFDPCPYHAKFNGLEIQWKKRNFINPPYSKLIEFVMKAHFQNRILGKTSYLLLPCKTDQRFFHFILRNDHLIKYFPFRIVFAGQKKPSPNTHCLVIMK